MGLRGRLFVAVGALAIGAGMLVNAVEAGSVPPSTDVTDPVESTAPAQPTDSSPVVASDPSTTTATTTTTVEVTSTSTSTTIASTPPAPATSSSTLPDPSSTVTPAPTVVLAAAIAPPAPPRSYRLTSIGDGRLSFAWTVPTTGVPGSGYRLSYAPSGGTWSDVDLGDRTSFTLTGLRNGTNYYVYLAAVNDAGASQQAKASGIPGRAPGGMSQPKASGGDHIVALTWVPPSDTGGYPITQYALQARTTGAWVTFTTVPGTARSYTVRNLTNGRGYSFRIAARNARGLGAWSYHIIGVPSAPLPPFGDGTFIVNTRVSAGLYVASGGAGCYWERLRGLGGTTDEIIANDFVDAGRAFVQILVTDRAFSSSRCGTWYRAGSVPPLVVGSTFAAGTYRVNAELRPGTYHSSGGVNCYWERLRGFSGEFSDVIANDLVNAPTYVQIAPTDIGFHAGLRCGTWTRVT